MVARADVYLPEEQAWQVALNEAPLAVENVPAEQEVQGSVFRTATAYVPAEHRGHWLTSLRLSPVEYVPAGHPVQSLLVPPKAVEYAPAPHA